MNIDDLQSTWQQQLTASEAAITINASVLSGIKINKQMHKLQLMKFARAIESGVFIVLIVILGQYITNNLILSAASVSAFILSIFALIGLAGNIGQLYLIAQIDYSKPVKTLQKEMYAICAHKLQLTKLLLLSLPFYMCYVFLGFDVLLGVDLLQHLEPHVMVFYAVTSILLLGITLWFLKKLSYKHIDTLWVKRVIRFIVGDNLTDMAGVINNIESPVNEVNK